MAIVYRHRRLDTNEVFYVGIGIKESRSRSHRGRNNYWKNIILKTEYEIEIVAKDLSLDDARELEIFMIELYGRKDLGTGSLVNMTDGGEGHLNPSEDTRKKLSINSKKLANTKSQLENAKKNIKKASESNIGRKHSDENIKTRIDKIRGGKHYCAKRVIEIKTGIIYECIKDAFKNIEDIKNINISYSAFVRRLRKDSCEFAKYE